MIFWNVTLDQQIMRCRLCLTLRPWLSERWGDKVCILSVRRSFCFLHTNFVLVCSSWLNFLESHALFHHDGSSTTIRSWHDVLDDDETIFATTTILTGDIIGGRTRISWPSFTSVLTPSPDFLEYFRSLSSSSFFLRVRCFVYSYVYFILLPR
jgi:hypothetical protein